jgi:hypothetical protein
MELAVLYGRLKRNIRTGKKHLKQKTGNVSTGSVTFREGSESADSNNGITDPDP